ncbi:hypothetical protein [Microvirga sp. VF16]|uniref:hypothetical protein n=1 Tax=Microvirga sp. VF16 TaxID=2807101 RepID=UPI00193E2CBE|nr:hypothetical protein [Microvirga sp. VF16]QRM32331.1 hypothetical protein JO965_29855 [Microvirga sp. VF16]
MADETARDLAKGVNHLIGVTAKLEAWQNQFGQSWAASVFFTNRFPTSASSRLKHGFPSVTGPGTTKMVVNWSH